MHALICTLHCSFSGSTKVADEEESNSSGSDSEEYESQKYARLKIVSNQSYYDKSLPDVDPEPCAASLEELAAADDVTGKDLVLDLALSKVI